MAFRCVRGACPAFFTGICILVETVAGRAKLLSDLLVMIISSSLSNCWGLVELESGKIYLNNIAFHFQQLST